MRALLLSSMSFFFLLRGIKLVQETQQENVPIWKKALPIPVIL